MEDILKIIVKDFIYYDCEMFKLLQSIFVNHPNYKDKIKNGNNGFVYSVNNTWGKNNYCFFIIDNDKNKIPISYNFKKSLNSNKNEVTKAFRTSIETEIFKFKKGFIPKVTKCEITGEIIQSTNDLHIDHHNFDFVKIVTDFLKKYNKTYDDLIQYVIVVNTKRFFNNKALIDYFTEFHNNNTTLRFTNKKANLSKKKYNSN